MNLRTKNRKRFLFPLFALAAVLAVGAVVQFLWNAILPSVANFNAIGYWQAVGLLILCKILFGGFAGKRGGPPNFGGWKDDGPGGGRFSSSWRRKWTEMSDEERMKFKQDLRNRWCKPPREAQSQQEEIRSTNA